MVRLKDVSVPSIPFLNKFQFHYGTIKSRLVAEAFIPNDKFQFHYGTIKSLKRLRQPTKQSYFNSTMVRLKVRYSPLSS